jgi:flavin-binding protein dodecin
VCGGGQPLATSATPSVGQEFHGTLPNRKFSFADAHNRQEEGGWRGRSRSGELPIATTRAGVNMRLQVGAVRQAVAEASKTMRGISSVYVSELQATVQNDRIKTYRANVKISFVLEREKP